MTRDMTLHGPYRIRVGTLFNARYARRGRPATAGTKVPTKEDGFYLFSRIHIPIVHPIRISISSFCRDNLMQVTRGACTRGMLIGSKSSDYVNPAFLRKKLASVIMAGRFADCRE